MNMVAPFWLGLALVDPLSANYESVAAALGNNPDMGTL
jgi:hypothetical protein